MKQALTPTAVLALAILANSAQAQDDSTLSTVVVTGNRGAEQRTVTSSPVPIDVVSAKQLQSTGKPGLMEALSAVIPSLTLPEKTGWDASGIARAPNLRGLSAAEVLVLVNGKRRHTSATLNINGINTGAAPADLDLIPISAIDHVEVLRDGAAAQYGSDAIAGVINVILKADTSGTSVTNVGQGYDGKKQTVQQSLNKGFEIGNGGIVQLALDARSPSMYNANCSTQLHSNIARSGTLRCNSFCTREAICVASKECPPNSKKLSLTPTCSTFNTSAHISAKVCSSSERGAR